MPTLRYVRVFDDQHRAVLLVNARPELADRIAYECLSQVEDGKSPENWREIWPKIRIIEEIGRQECRWNSA